MTFAPAFRLAAVAAVAALSFSAASAQALTINTAALAADSVQTFSQDALDSFELFGVSVAPLGNAYAKADTPNAYVLPVTSISLDGLKISSGEAKGSALEISRVFKGQKIGVTLANFTIDFKNNLVLADTTPIGGQTVTQAPVYSFVKIKELAIKYKFPLSITADEQLGSLILTPASMETQITALQLNRVLAGAVLPTLDFGTIDIDVAVKLRKAVSTKPYTPVAP